MEFSIAARGSRRSVSYLVRHFVGFRSGQRTTKKVCNGLNRFVLTSSEMTSIKEHQLTECCWPACSLPMTLTSSMARLSLETFTRQLSDRQSTYLPGLGERGHSVKNDPQTPFDGILGDIPLDEVIIGYSPDSENTVSLSSVLKKRKQKMNQHKYKKRRKRDRFKRRNLENIKERKKRVKEKSDEREKQAVM
ncbi:predicted protein [Nematostella vectensis]|uniref:Small ribosomal subunit protein mS38 n=1 Tax=Nematostella vectensis TaxID=45351 RepID=A7REV3_NEMVE|nr:predicted protein [Nematostella vectensis]|eukprot:XP_001641915.1 predicted protein [Nematostella vectensis]